MSKSTLDALITVLVPAGTITAVLMLIAAWYIGRTAGPSQADKEEAAKQAFKIRMDCIFVALLVLGLLAIRGLIGL